jgi:hypothetical protein
MILHPRVTNFTIIIQAINYSIMEKNKYSEKAQKKIGVVMEEYKEGTLKSGRSGKKVKSRKQAVAIGISEARKAGGKVPAKKS